MKKARDLRMYLRDVLESSDHIVEYVKNKDIKDFRSDTQAQDAVIRRFQIIGEAVKRVPMEFREQHPEVSWSDAAAFRSSYDALMSRPVVATSLGLVIVCSIDLFQKSFRTL